MTDHTIANGAVIYYVGTHLPVKIQREMVGKKYSTLEIGESVQMTLYPGQSTIWAGNLLHQVAGNKTENARYTAFFTYQVPSWGVAYEPQNYRTFSLNGYNANELGFHFNMKSFMKDMEGQALIHPFEIINGPTVLTFQILSGSIFGYNKFNGNASLSA